MENIRHEQILKILEKRGNATVKQLSDELFVCETLKNLTNAVL